MAEDLAQSSTAEQEPQFHKTLGPFMLWGLGVGYVISGMYLAGTLGCPRVVPTDYSPQR